MKSTAFEVADDFQSGATTEGRPYMKIWLSDFATILHE
jgi:hypothetical protein